MRRSGSIQERIVGQYEEFNFCEKTTGIRMVICIDSKSH